MSINGDPLTYMYNICQPFGASGLKVKMLTLPELRIFEGKRKQTARICSGGDQWLVN